MVLIDAAGSILWANTAIEPILGTAPEGRPLGSLVTRSGGDSRSAALRPTADEDDAGRDET